MWIRIALMLLALSCLSALGAEVKAGAATGLPATPPENKGPTTTYQGSVAVVNNAVQLTVFDANNVRTPQKITLVTAIKDVGNKMQDYVLRSSFVNATGYMSADRSTMNVTNIDEITKPKRIKN
jgi:hypothetical protein